MSRNRLAWSSLALILLLMPQVLRAEPFLFAEVSLTTGWKPGPQAIPGTEVPSVRSYARAYLYDRSTGFRIYQQIILDHGVFDMTSQRTLYTSKLESANGYISNTTRDLLGDRDHCYSGVATGHSNDFNLHYTPPRSTACMPPPPDPPEKPEIPEENCPVLLDLEMDGFHLSGPEPAVLFDIDADGDPDRIAWTRANEDDAFLCLDRNGNGTIDDGTELFGYATPLLSGERARIGYRALADLDHSPLGGNGDGKIDAGDVLFASLCVWNDQNRNGVSEPGELRSAAAVGVVSLDYAYRTTGQRDSFGNLFRYVSRAELRTRSGRVRSWLTYDVIFAAAEP